MYRVIASPTVLLVLGCSLLACDEDTGDPKDTADTGTAPTEDCETVEFDDGSSGTYVVDSSADDHVKHHWYMPEGVDHLVVTGTWDTEEDDSWVFELAVGTGTCPHSGTEYGGTEGSGGELVVELYPSDVEEGAETFTADEKWFAHFGLVDQTHSDGDTTDYAFDVQACTAVD